jgi:hypothetical protein
MRFDLCTNCQKYISDEVLNFTPNWANTALWILIVIVLLIVGIGGILEIREGMSCQKKRRR